MITINRLEFNDREKGEFLELMSTSLSTHSIDWLEWKYIKNPLVDGQPTVFGAIHNSSGKLVGIRPFLACNVAFGDKILKAAQPGDTVVHPDYRGRGLFTEMNKVAIQELQKEGYDLFFNFPNRNSQPGYLKMGWEKVLVFDESLAFNNFSKVVKYKTGSHFFELGGKILSIGLSNLPKIIRRLSSKNFNVPVSIEENFDDSIETLWLNKEPNRFRVKRDSSYLNWRFKKRPDKKYKYWTISENDKLLAYMITTTSDRWGPTEGQIVDFNFTEDKYFFVILESVLKEFQLNGCNFVSILACTEKSIFQELRKIGFIHRFQFPYKIAMPERNFLVRALNTELLKYDLYNGENWSLRSGDQDTY